MRAGALKFDRRQTTAAGCTCGDRRQPIISRCFNPALGAEGKRIGPMTEKRRRDEPQLRLAEWGPGSNLEARTEIDRDGAIPDPRGRLHGSNLGEQRAGSGVVIRDNGLVLTIGYLDHRGRERLADRCRRPGRARPCARHDQETGFGLVQALAGSTAGAELGRSSEAKLGDPVVVAAGGGRHPASADDRRQAGVRRLLGVSARGGDLHRARPSPGAERRDRADGKLLGVGSLHAAPVSERASRATST